MAWKASLLNGYYQRRKEAFCLDMAVRNCVGPKVLPHLQASHSLCHGFMDGGEGCKTPELNTKGFITVR